MLSYGPRNVYIPFNKEYWNILDSVFRKMRFSLIKIIIFNVFMFHMIISWKADSADAVNRYYTSRGIRPCVRL